MKEEDRRAEKASAEAVAEVLGGVLEWRDTCDAAASTHDYDIVLTDGSRIVAVEVTAVTLPSDRALESEFKRIFRRPLRGLRGRWLVHVDGPLPSKHSPRAYVEELRGCLERLLPRFESGSPSLDELEDLYRRWPDPRCQVPQHQQLHDEHTNSPAKDNPWAQRASERFGCSESAVSALVEMSKARVLSVIPLNDEGSPHEPNVIVRSPVRSGAIGPNDLSEAVEAEAAKCDNRRKLASACAHERHLVISFDPMSLKGRILAHDEDSLADRKQPRPPLLPQEVDTAWAVLPSDPPIVWRYDRDDPAWQLSRPAKPTYSRARGLDRSVPNE